MSENQVNLRAYSMPIDRWRKRMQKFLMQRTLPLIKCLGCPRLFVPKRPNQRYHEGWCQKAVNKHKRTGPRAGYPDPHWELINALVLFLTENAPRGVVGYRLHCRELDITLPWPGSLRRNGTKPKESKDFQLDELPLLPLLTSYEVIWVYAGGGALPSYPPKIVSLGWVDDMRNMGEVGRRLRLYLARRRKEDAVAAEVHKELIALAHSSTPVVHQLPPHQLPPDQQGQPDGDTSGT